MKLYKTLFIPTIFILLQTTFLKCPGEAETRIPLTGNDAEIVQRLKDNEKERQEILSAKLSFFRSKPREYRLAERAQNDIDQINQKKPNDIKKEEFKYISKLRLYKFDIQDLISLATPFNNEELPKDLQNSINQKFIEDQRSFPNDGIRYLYLTEDIIAKLTNMNEIKYITENQISTFLEKNKKTDAKTLIYLAKKFAPKELPKNLQNAIDQKFEKQSNEFTKDDTLYVSQEAKNKVKEDKETKKQAIAQAQAKKEEQEKAKQQSKLKRELTSQYPGLVNDVQDLGFNISDILNKQAWQKFYRKKALVLHPDKPGGDTEKFQVLSIINDNLNKFYEHNNIN